MDNDSASDDKYRLRILERAIAVLFEFSADTPTLSLEELAASSGINKTSLVRILRTLEPAGFVLREEDRYRLGPRVLGLANVYLSTLSFHKVAEPHMHALAVGCGQTVSLAVLDGLEIVYVAIERAQRDIGIQGEIGGRHPVNATALGKVLLTALDPQRLRARLADADLPRLTHRTIVDRDELQRVVERVRRDGYALDDEERGIGIRCVAAPIHDFTGRVVAAMSVAGPIFDMHEGTLETIRARLLEAANAVSRELGYEAAQLVAS